MKKIISYNVNGIRAAMKKDLIGFINQEQPTVLCFQEIKANIEQIDEPLFKHLGYHCHWFSAQKKGYSGTAILSKEKPLHIEYGIGVEQHDFEGRIIRADFSGFSILNIYFPSGTSGEERQAYKYTFLDDIYAHVKELRKTIPNLIVCGDYNICHTAIDIHNPKQNKNTSGFLPEERAWMDRFTESGMIDTFRAFNKDPDHYSWWSYRANARANNKGWRIDYHMASTQMKEKLQNAYILPKAVHSDHCPVVVEIND